MPDDPDSLKGGKRHKENADLFFDDTSACAARLRTVRNYYLLDSSKAGRLYDVCSLGDELVLLGSAGVWLHQPKTGEMTALLKYDTDLMENPIATDYRSLDHIFVQNGVMYVYYSHTSAFYRVEDHAATPCLENAAEIFTFDNQGETMSAEIQQRGILSKSVDVSFCASVFASSCISRIPQAAVFFAAILNPQDNSFSKIP